MTRPRFRYDPAVLEQFPSTRAAIVEVSNVGDIDPTALAAEYRTVQASIADRLEHTPIAEVESVAAWRRVFSRLGVKPTQYRSAVEALLRRLSKRGDVPSINPFVDLGNLVSINHGLPVAVFDLERVPPPITVCFARGDEEFNGIGTSEKEHPNPGEVIFVDSAGAVCARRWCWRQSAHSAARPDSRRVLYVIEGHHEAASEDVAAAGRQVARLAQHHLHATPSPIETLPPDHDPG